jgi:hypothetical protein
MSDELLDAIDDEADFLVQLGEEDFAAQLIEHVSVRPKGREVQTQAFRHARVVARTAQTLDRLLRHHGPIVQQAPDESRNAYTARSTQVRKRCEFELRLAKLIVAGEQARAGRLPEPDPVRKAHLALAAQHPEEFIALKRRMRAGDNGQ